MSKDTLTPEEAERLMAAAVRHDAFEHRRNDDAHTKAIVKMTVAEIFEGVGVDLATTAGRERFRAVHQWSGDAMDGTGVLRKTAFGAIIATFVTGAAFGLWTMLGWIYTITRIKGSGP